MALFAGPSVADNNLPKAGSHKQHESESRWAFWIYSLSATVPPNQSRKRALNES